MLGSAWDGRVHRDAEGVGGGVYGCLCIYRAHYPSHEVVESDQRRPGLVNPLGFVLEMFVHIGDAPSEGSDYEIKDSSSKVGSVGRGHRCLVACG